MSRNLFCPCPANLREEAIKDPCTAYISRISPMKLPYRSLDRQEGKTIPFTNQCIILQDSYQEEFCKKGEKL
jgi:hypothetical protein